MSPKFLVIDLQDGYSCVLPLPGFDGLISLTLTLSDFFTSFCRRFMSHYHGGFELSSHSILFSEGSGNEFTRYLLTPKEAPVGWMDKLGAVGGHAGDGHRSILAIELAAL